MKYIFSFLTLFSFLCGECQLNYKFDKRFIDAEDQWVVFPMNKDSTYNYGFIYLDVQAGLTMNFEGQFRIAGDGSFIPNKPENSMMKYRLQPSRVQIAIIPESKYKELKITAVPDWLKNYQTDTNSVRRLYKLGFTLNAWDECGRALGYLERAWKKDSTFSGLDVELAYSYNCLGQFDKAIVILKKAIKDDPDDCYLYKEYCYSLLKSGQLAQASEATKKGISVCEENSMKAEIAYNMAYEYYSKKDKANFKIWAAEARNWTEKGDQFSSNLSKMESELGIK